MLQRREPLRRAQTRIELLGQRRLADKVVRAGVERLDQGLRLEM